VEALGAEVAGVVGPHEGGDDQVAALEAGDVDAEVLHHAQELMAHGSAGLGGRHGPIGPQVAAADG
jgi:hypothetical protein